MKDLFWLIWAIVGLAIAVMGTWYGLVDHEYAKGCFYLLVAWGGGKVNS